MLIWGCVYIDVPLGKSSHRDWNHTLICVAWVRAYWEFVRLYHRHPSCETPITPFHHSLPLPTNSIPKILRENTMFAIEPRFIRMTILNEIPEREAPVAP